MKQKRVIVLYGPPGIGKLTVGRQLLGLTKNFKLFHVHLLADLIASMFKTGTKEFVDCFTHLWFYLFEKALSAKIDGLIVTLIYGIQTLEGKNDDKFFADISHVAKEKGAIINFVKLKCSNEELHRRVKSESRKHYGKLTDTALVDKIRKKYKKVDQIIPSVNSLVIDTTHLTSRQTAKKILDGLRIS